MEMATSSSLQPTAASGWFPTAALSASATAGTTRPLRRWLRAPTTDSVRKQGNIGDIRDVLVLRQARVILLAADGGIFWSRIGPSPGKSGPPASDDFHWRQAIVLTGERRHDLVMPAS
jgi:hypothetical protein